MRYKVQIGRNADSEDVSLGPSNFVGVNKETCCGLPLLLYLDDNTQKKQAMTDTNM